MVWLAEARYTVKNGWLDDAISNHLASRLTPRTFSRANDRTMLREPQCGRHAKVVGQWRAHS